jgi:hypothetical protein
MARVSWVHLTEGSILQHLSAREGVNVQRLAHGFIKGCGLDCWSLRGLSWFLAYPGLTPWAVFMPLLRGWICVGRSLVKTDRIFLINGAAELCSGIVLVKSDIPYNAKTDALHCHGRAARASGFVVLFVALHNWIPLETLNDVKGASLRVDLSYGRGSSESIKGWAFIQGV